MDVVYIVRPGDANEMLRYSLRSLANLPHRDVYMVGHRPSWVTGVEHVPGNRATSKTQNVHDNVRIACDIGEASDVVVLMNDDFFIVHPDPPLETWWRRPLIDHIASIRRWSPWRQSLEAARDWLATVGIPDPLSYELHVPLPMNRRAMASVLDEVGMFSPLFPPQWRTVYGNRLGLGGTQHPDVKVGTAGEWDPAWPFLSCSPQSWDGAVGRHIRAMFPEPSPYER